MKDALGHGSDARGTAHERLLIQRLNTALAGSPWATVKAVSKSRSLVNPAAKAERIAMRMRIDQRHLHDFQPNRVIYRKK